MKKACELTGKSRATVYRRRGGIRSGCRERRPAAPNALSSAEREELLAVLDGPRFQDKAPRQVWALLIDEGTYLASVSTMYRLLREAGQVRERRAQAAHPARTKPELIATGPNQVGQGCGCWGCGNARSCDTCRRTGPHRSSPDSSAGPSRGAPGEEAVCRLAAIRATLASYSPAVM